MRWTASVFVASLLAICIGAGCAAFEAPDPFQGDEFKATESTPAHPLSVLVTVVQEGAERFPSGVLVPALLRPEKEKDLREDLADALERHNAFTLVVTEEKPEFPVDLELRVVASRVDPVLDSNGKEPESLALGVRKWNGNQWYNGFLWLLAGFPGWILADTDFNPPVEVRYELLRRPDGVPLMQQSVSFDEYRSLNFVRRAAAWQYAQQVVVPPPLTSPDEAKTDESLFENFLSRMQSDISQKVKKGFDDNQRDRLGEAPLLKVVTAEGKTYVFILSYWPPEPPLVCETGTPGSTPEETELQFQVPERDSPDSVEKEPIKSFTELEKRFWDAYKSNTIPNLIYAELPEGAGSTNSARIKAFFTRERPQEKPWTWTVKSSPVKPTGDSSSPAPPEVATR
jgi:hypothetical protein